MPSNWEVIRNETVHENPWYSIGKYHVKTPHGKEGTYFIVERAPAVCIIAVNEQGEFGVITTFRPTINRESIEFPAGGVEENESIEDAAKRELLEETGLKAEHIEIIAEQTIAVGLTNQMLYICVAHGIRKEKQQLEKLEEGVIFEWKKDKEIMKLIKSKHIIDSATKGAFYEYLIEK